MIGLPKTKLKGAISKYSKEIELYYSDLLIAAKAKRTEVKAFLSDEELVYFDEVISAFQSSNPITWTSEEIAGWISSIGPLPEHGSNNKMLKLKDRILSILDYEGMRSEFFPMFFLETGIKTCVYCNSQFALTVDAFTAKGYSNPKQYIAKFELDHKHSKQLYPFLALSVYNLYPSCKPCNNIKGVKEVDFDLYSGKIDSSDFNFYIDKVSKVEFLLSNRLDDLKIGLAIPENGAYDSIFQISSIYQTQKDVAEELIMKAKIYNESYKAMLGGALGGIFRENGIYKRMILGNYADVSDIHKRPLAKFMQDIAKDIGLI